MVKAFVGEREMLANDILEKLGICNESGGSTAIIPLHSSKGGVYKIDIPILNRCYLAKMYYHPGSRTEQEIEREQKAQQYLERCNYPFREFIYQATEPLKYALLGYLPGQQLSSPEALVDHDLILTIARDLRNIHMSTSPRYYGRNIETENNNPLDVGFCDFVSEYVLNDLRVADVPNLERVEGLMRAKGQQLTTKYLSLVHGDINYHNLIQSNGSPVLIDWGHAQFSDPASDLAQLIFYFHNANQGDSKSLVFELADLYGDMGINIQESLQFFLALREISYGRYLYQRNKGGIENIEEGLRLLEAIKE